jgi:preprotein translocase subunit SecG
MSLVYSFAIFLFLFLSFVLCVTILVQEGKGGGLGASFGGGEASDSLFGTATPEILKKFTAWLAVAFVATCILLSFWTSSLSRRQFSRMPTTNDVEIVK